MPRIVSTTLNSQVTNVTLTGTFRAPLLDVDLENIIARAAAREWLNKNMSDEFMNEWRAAAETARAELADCPDLETLLNLLSIHE